MGLDYYAILDAPHNASMWDLKMSYRKLALRLHPQRKNYPQHPNPPPADVFELPLPALPENAYWEYINEAFDVLTNPMYREVYDKYGEEGLKRGIAAPNGIIPPYRYHGDAMRTYFEVFGSFSPYADLSDAATNPPPLYAVKEGVGVKNKDPTIERLLHVGLDEVFHGGMKLVKIFRHEFVDEFKTKTEVKETMLSVPISPGILEGTRLVYPEAGDRGPTRIPSDIVFIVCDKPHSVFRRDKCDLHMNYNITLKEALTGFKLSLQTIDDRKLEILITDIIDCNYVKRIQSEGIPNPYNNRVKGDLMVHFHVTFPEFIPKPLRSKLIDTFDEIEQIHSAQSGQHRNSCKCECFDTK
jgi:DnaJ family protein B protein 13